MQMKITRHGTGFDGNSMTVEMPGWQLMSANHNQGVVVAVWAKACPGDDAPGLSRGELHRLTALVALHGVLAGGASPGRYEENAGFARLNADEMQEHLDKADADDADDDAPQGGTDG